MAWPTQTFEAPRQLVKAKRLSEIECMRSATSRFAGCLIQHQSVFGKSLMPLPLVWLDSGTSPTRV